MTIFQHMCMWGTDMIS